MTRNKNKKNVLPTRKLKKDPGVPKLPNLRVKKDIKKSINPSIPAPPGYDVDMSTEGSLSALAASVSAMSESELAMGSQQAESSSQTKRQYIRTLHQVVEQSDVVILVLDARDPEGCRSKLVEEEVRRREREGKRLVFVLNKIDLIPKENALAWLRYLRHTAPTVPFRSSTQEQSNHLVSRSSPALISLIKSYRNSPAGRITVGVTGYPNVGKSSLINSLKRSKVCAIAAEPGWTKELQSVQIDRGIRIIDSPGVVFDDIDEDSAKARAGVLLRNVVKVEDVEDPLAIVEEILARTEKETLQKIYKLPDWKNMLEFMTMLALSSGRLLKGGTPDLTATARSILKDWNANKIPYFSIPPAVHPSSMPSNAPGAENVGEASIVQGGFAPAFDLGGLYEQAMQQDEDMLQSSDGAMDEDGIAMESDELQPQVPRKRSRSETPEDIHPGRRPVMTPSEAGALPSARGPVPKRARPSYDAVIDPQEQATMAVSNPLGRRNVKANLKRDRKAARRMAKSRDQGMTVDDIGEAVEFTFRVPDTSLL